MEDKKELTTLLYVLLGQMNGCVSPSCGICRDNRKRVERLAELLGIEAADIMPFFLKNPNSYN